MAWADSRRAYRFLTEDRPWNQEAVASTTCRKDGRSCLMIVSRERIEYAAKGWLFEAYLGGDKLDRLISMQIIRSDAQYCQLRMRFQGGAVMAFDKMADDDALTIAETIAGLTSMHGTDNLWDR